MQKKPASQELAQKALELLNETDKLEEEQNWAKAIEKYQQVVDYLKQSGYLPHRIEDILKRISEIKNFLEQEKQYQTQEQQIQLEQVQEQAFAILDGAKKFENDGYFEDAIQQYMSAIKLLAESGWTESQLENLKSKILSLTENLERQKLIQGQREISYHEQQAQIPVDSKPQKISIDTVQSTIGKKSEQIKAFEAKRKREEQIQNEAFQIIDQAKIFEKEKRYDNAINNYQEAIRLLNSIGWTDQTKNLQILIGKLKRNKENFERVEAQRKEKLYFEEIEVKLGPDQSESQTKVEVRKQKLMEFESKKKKEEEIQTKAFNLIDIGKRLEREKKYDDAIENFQKAIKLLQSISWDSYIQPVANFINGIKEKMERELKAEQIKKKRQDDLNKLQETIYKKKKEKIVQTAQEFEIRKKDFEQEKLKQAEREEQFFNLLDNADKILQEEKNYDKAVNEYEKALGMLKDLGAGWESYIITIKATISNIKQRKEYQSKNELEILKEKDKRIEKELEFQKQVDDLLKKERKKLEQKEIELREHEEELRYREQAKKRAFQFLETGQEYIKQGDFDKAIYAYQNAGSIFAEIQWTDELPLIEKSISELEMRKKDLFSSRQEEMQKLTEREKQERDFQMQLATQLRLEREKLKQKEITLREHERELEYRETRKNDAFKLLDEAQNYTKNGDFDNASEIYHQIANIFAEIQWDNEIDLIQNAIIEIENKKREAQIQKQNDFQKVLEKERDERIFQEDMSKAIQNQMENLKEKEIIIRDQEEELKHRENKKEEAFELLDKARTFLSLRKFDEALEIYYNVANVFAQIQWADEIPIIQNAIKEIKEKKKEKDLWKQKAMEKAIEEDTAYQAFIDQMKTQREIEKSKLLEKSELIEKQKKLSAQILAKQENSFKIIDEADEFLKQEKFDEAIKKYKAAESTLTEIGWAPSYLRLLQENLKTIQNRKLEKEKEKEREKEIREKRQLEELQFQSRITDEIQKEKERMEAKKIELQQREVLKSIMEDQKSKAFSLIEEAEKLLSKGQYEQSLEKYRQVDLIFSEIQFPAQVIKDTILKVEEKKREESLTKQKELERQLKKNQEEFLFKQQISEKMVIEKQKMQSKQIEVKKKEELKEYMENRKNDAFKLLEDAEMFINQSQYDKALEFYQSAELILNEVQYPSDVIRDLIYQVREKKKNYEIVKQKEFEFKIQREREDYEFQKKITEDFRKEKERLSVKKLELEEKEILKAKLEEKREQAFSILDEAQNFTKQLDYDRAIEYYRKAELILNELHFSTESIKRMIAQVISLKNEKEKEQELELKRELERIEEDKQLRALIEERKRQEGEKKIAQQIAIQQREKLIQEQISQREAAYALLEEAGKYLKSRIPDYDKAISLYLQARKILAEKIGWEPEINNLEALIKDLQQEKANFLERQRIEGQAQLKRQQEYELFKEEMRRKRIDHEKQMEDQKSKLKQFEERKELESALRDEGLKLIGEGKRNAELKAFDKAYQMFERAISHFREIGWDEQIKYIETEIKNVKILDEKFKHEKLERERIQDELQKQRKLEMEKWKQEDLQIRATIGEVGSLTDEISSLFRAREEQLIVTEAQKNQQIKNEANEFSRNISRMLRIKQELLSELKKTEEEEKKKRADEQKAKEREEVDEIARMLRELKKKDK